MKRLILAAAVLVLVADAAVFARVAWNRSGEAETIILTERELKPPYDYHSQQEDNSGLSLQLEWRVPPVKGDDRYRYHDRGMVLDEPKFQDLGFHPVEDCGSLRDYRRPQELSRRGWVALEYDGPAHAETLRRLRRELQQTDEQQERDRFARELEDAELRDTRIYAVDVAPERDELMEKYRGSDQHIILAAELRNAGDCTQKLKIYISRLLTSSINVPVELHPLFEDLPQRPLNAGWQPAYRATLAIGRLAEQWLIDGERLETAETPSSEDLPDDGGLLRCRR